MTPTAHGYGHSFKGVGAYLLHDQEASTSDRVGWTEVRNMGVDDAQAAIGIMAATAMDQDRLKKQAGVKMSGRKPTKGSVYHYSISWPEDQAEGLTPEEMKRAAYATLRYLKADTHQALLVAHTDTEKPHVHVVINRVSTEDGRMLNHYNDFKKFSRWAQKYEEETGKIYCEQRVINNAARDRGEFVRGEKRPPRNVYEERKQQAANQNIDEKRAAAERLKTAALAKKSHEMRERHKAELQKLEAGHKARILAIAEQRSVAARKDIAFVRSTFRPRWEQQHHEHQAQKALFAQREKTLIGRMQNAYKALDIPGRVGRKHEGMEVSSVGGMFGAISSAGARKEALKAQQERDKKALEARQKEAEKQLAQERKAEEKQKLEKNRQRFTAERMTYLFKRDMELAKVRAEWRERNAQRKEVLKGDGGRVPAVGKKTSPELSAEDAARLASIAQSAAELSQVKRNRGRSIERDDGQER